MHDGTLYAEFLKNLSIWKPSDSDDAINLTPHHPKHDNILPKGNQPTKRLYWQLVVDHKAFLGHPKQFPVFPHKNSSLIFNVSATVFFLQLFCQIQQIQTSSDGFGVFWEKKICVDFGETEKVDWEKWRTVDFDEKNERLFGMSQKCLVINYCYYANRAYRTVIYMFFFLQWLKINALLCLFYVSWLRPRKT